MKHTKKAWLIPLFIGIAFLPSLSGLLVEPEGWYETLNKPAWTPHHLVFAPVWTKLYILIGLAGYFAWTRGAREERPAVFAVYGVQLFVNALWGPLFFGLHRPDLSMASLVLLWFMILLCIALFRDRSHLAAWLMVPYLLWISFAGALNATIMAFN